MEDNSPRRWNEYMSRNDAGPIENNFFNHTESERLEEYA